MPRAPPASWDAGASTRVPGTTVTDSSGSGVHGTAVGGPPWVPGYPLGAPTPVLAFTPGRRSRWPSTTDGSTVETVDLAG